MTPSNKQIFVVYYELRYLLLLQKSFPLKRSSLYCEYIRNGEVEEDPTPIVADGWVTGHWYLLDVCLDVSYRFLHYQIIASQTYCESLRN